MKVTFKKDELLAAITRSLGCVVSERTHSAADGILLNTLSEDICQITAYDFEKGIRTNISVKAEEEGSMVVDGARFASIVKFMPGDVTVETSDKNVATITSGRSRFQINVFPGDEFQQMPIISPDRSFDIPQKVLKNIMNQTAFAISGDDSRPALTGLYFEVTADKLKAVACDTFCLAVRELSVNTNIYSKSGETKIGFILPLRTVNELLRLLEDTDEIVHFDLTRKNIIITFDFKVGREQRTNIIQSRLIDTLYIEYDRIIPKERKTLVTLSKTNLEEALSRASLITEDKIAGQAKSIVKFNFQGQMLTLNTTSINGNVIDEIPIEKEGADLMIGFSCKYLLKILRGTDDEYLKLSLTSVLMSMVIEGASENSESKFLYLAMPIKMRE